MVLAPIVRGRKGEYGKQLEELRAEGFGRVKVDGELRRLDEEIVLDKKYKHDIAVVVDRLVMKGELRKRLADSIETAVALADGLVEIELVDTGPPAQIQTYSERFACPVHGPSLIELEPRIFSFNSPHGACPRCTGLGSQMEIDPDLVVPDPTLSIGEGAIAPWSVSASDYYDQLAQAISERYRVDLETPWQDLEADQRDFFLHGTNGDRVQISYRNRFGRRRSYATQFEGIVPESGAALPGDGLRVHPGADRGVHDAAALPGVPRGAAAARVPCGAGRRHGDPRVHRAVGAAGARVGQGAGPQRARPADRAAGAAGDRGAASVPGERRRRIPVDGAGGRDAVRRRGTANPAGHPDRLLAGRACCTSSTSPRSACTSATTRS